MPVPDINISVTDGALLRAPEGKDHYTGIVVYSDDEATVSPVQAGSYPEFLTNAELDEADAPKLCYIVKTAFQKAASIAQRSPLLFIASYAVPGGAHDFAEVTSLGHNLGAGEIRQFAVYTEKTYASTQVTALQTALDNLATDRAYASAVLSWGTLGSYSGATDFSTGTSPNVSALHAKGTGPLSLPPIGVVAGIMSIAKVSDSIGRNDLYNLDLPSDEVTKLGDGALISTLSKTTLSALVDKNWLVPFQYVGYAGHYIAIDKTCKASTSDYSRIRNQRTVDKAKRSLYLALVPYINTPLKVAADGKLSPEVVKKYEGICRRALQPMKTNEEVSDFGVSIDPNQIVASTGTLNTVFKIVPIGATEAINVSLSLALNLTQ